jgi:hypothetical protein
LQHDLSGVSGNPAIVAIGELDVQPDRPLFQNPKFDPPVDWFVESR